MPNWRILHVTSVHDVRHRRSCYLVIKTSINFDIARPPKQCPNGWPAVTEGDGQTVKRQPGVLAAPRVLPQALISQFSGEMRRYASFF